MFEPRLNEAALRKTELTRGLQDAIDKNQFLLHYQPKVDLNTGAMTGVEALLRWNHPNYGLVFPDQFIPVSEESGIIVPMGQWVLQEACKQYKRWQESNEISFRIAVNISLQQFHHIDFVDMVKKVLQETHFDPQRLELEITESVIHDPEKTIHILNELQSLGILISMDDFGKGYSSLSYLKRLPIEILKIDRSFIRDISTDPVDAEIVTAIITLAKSLNLKVVAEGVETEEQLAFIKKYKCTEAQGFLFSKPMSELEFFEKFILNKPAVSS